MTENAHWSKFTLFKRQKTQPHSFLTILNYRAIKFSEVVVGDYQMFLLWILILGYDGAYRNFL